MWANSILGLNTDRAASALTVPPPQPVCGGLAAASKRLPTYRRQRQLVAWLCGSSIRESGDAGQERSFPKNSRRADLIGVSATCVKNLSVLFFAWRSLGGWAHNIHHLHPLRLCVEDAGKGCRMLGSSRVGAATVRDLQPAPTPTFGIHTPVGPPRLTKPSGPVLTPCEAIGDP